MCLAVPGELVEIVETDPLARQGRVNFGGVIKTIALDFLPEAEVGQYVLVHAGVAISVVDADEAQRTFEYLGEIDELDGIEEAAP